MEEKQTTAQAAVAARVYKDTLKKKERDCNIPTFPGFDASDSAPHQKQINEISTDFSPGAPLVAVSLFFFFFCKFVPGLLKCLRSVVASTVRSRFVSTTSSGLDINTVVRCPYIPIPCHYVFNYTSSDDCGLRRYRHSPCQFFSVT